MNSIGNIQNKNIVLLQGPMGSFFKKLDSVFRDMGAKTYKIGFNAGDCFYSHRDNYTAYRGKRKNWALYLHEFFLNNDIHQIYIFGDCRFYQAEAIIVAKGLGVDVFVFEEGYIRPYYITLERFGVNDFSMLSRERSFYDEVNLDDFGETDVEDAGFKAGEKVWASTWYYIVSNLFFFLYPYYKHHRRFIAIEEAFYGVRSFVRKYIYKYKERKYLDLLTKKIANEYYFVPLQTYNDFQLLEHSEYKSIRRFIVDVMASFSKNAPAHTKLVFKHHPVDRGRRHYERFIKREALKYGVSDKIIIIHDVHLPSCLKNAIATITINSTVGLSSIYHKTPTLTLGNAVYDIEGITCKGCALAEFWKKQYIPDMVLFEKYKRYIITHTQLNGSFYGKMPKFSFNKKNIS